MTPGGDDPVGERQGRRSTGPVGRRSGDRDVAAASRSSSHWIDDGEGRRRLGPVPNPEIAGIDESPVAGVDEAIEARVEVEVAIDSVGRTTPLRPPRA